MPFRKSDPIQSLCREHLEDVFELLRAIYENQNPDHPMGGGWTRSMIRKELELGRGIGFFDASGYLRGLILYRTLPGPNREISILGSHPRWRGQGIMTRLLKIMQAELGSGAIWLEVHEKNLPAIRLYETLGFEKSGERSAYYRDGCAAILYSLGAAQIN